MAGGIHSNRWRDYLRDIHRVLRPGGWVQTVEIYFNAQSDNGTLTQSAFLPFPFWAQLLTFDMARSRTSKVVETISGQHTTVQRPSSSLADAELDAKCRLRLGGDANDPAPDLRMVQRYGIAEHWVVDCRC